MWHRIRNRLLLGAVLVAGLLTATAIGVGFLLAGSYLSLAMQVGSAQAALIVGAAILVLIAIALTLALRPRRGSRSARASAADDGDGEALRHAGVRVAEALAANQRQAAVLALGIGILLAISPRARDMVRLLAPAPMPDRTAR